MQDTLNVRAVSPAPAIKPQKNLAGCSVIPG
jgi:hypothetical protein